MINKVKNRFELVITYILLAIISMAFAFPLLWVFMTSFKTPREYYSMPPSVFPKQFQIFHYKEAFAPWTINPTELSEATYFVEESAGRVESVLPNILNSFIIVGGSVTLSLFVGIWAAYALSRFKFKGSNVWGGMDIIYQDDAPNSTCSSNILDDEFFKIDWDAYWVNSCLCTYEFTFCSMDDEKFF